MQEFPWAGIVVVTYGALFTAALTAVVALFRRMGRVEQDTARLSEAAQRADESLVELRKELKDHGKVLADAMTDFKVHMAEEAASVHRLETLIRSALPVKEKV